MNKKWMVILIILFATVAGAAIVISSAVAPKEKPYEAEFLLDL